MNNMKKRISLLVVFLLCLSIFPFSVFAEASIEEGRAKNVIIMIPDGMSIEALTYARFATDSKSFALDSMATGLVRTNNSDTPIADSAPAATAMATGHKSEAPFVGVAPSIGGMPGAEEFKKENAYRPLATVMEAAKRQGKSIGIVSTSKVQHATPAAFTSHNPERGNYDDLGEQQVYQDIDVVLGAGSKHLDPKKRKDGEDLIEEIKSLGYSYVDKPEQMQAVKDGKLWGMFDSDALAYDLDRDPAKEPALYEMTEKALDLLSKNEEGFVLMVEGSEIDWGGHANDLAAMIGDIFSFDKAVAVVKDFVEKTPDTVLVIAADHGTGGLTFGSNKTDHGYQKKPLDSFVSIMRRATMTAEGIEYKLNEDKSNLKALMKEAYGITDMTKEEVDSIMKSDSIATAIGHVVSDRSGLAWTTRGHVGGDVALYSYVNSKTIKPLTGTVFNKDIGRYIEKVLGVDLDELTEELYQLARPGFEKKGATVTFKKAENTNSTMLVKKGDTTLTFPISKNFCFVNGKKVMLDGLTIYNDRSVYVPRSAFYLIK